MNYFDFALGAIYGAALVVLVQWAWRAGQRLADKHNRESSQ